LSTASAAAPSMYARLLRVRQLRLSGLTSFLLFEGVMAIATLLALAELVSWWGVLVLPMAVAGMVKFNDVLAGTLSTRRWTVAPHPAALAGIPADPATVGAHASGRLVPAARHEAPSTSQPVRVGGRQSTSSASVYPYPARIAGQRGAGQQTRYLATGVNERWLRWSA
jgi:hypothetical protein